MCFGPSTLGAGAKTRLESRIKKFTPHSPGGREGERMVGNIGLHGEHAASTRVRDGKAGVVQILYGLNSQWQTL